MKNTALVRAEADQVLVKLQAARTSLESARTVQTAKRSLDVVAALRRYAQHQQLGREVEAVAYEVEIRALINLGDVLAVMPKATGAKGIGRSAVDKVNRTPETPTYREIGLEKTRAYLAQQLASLPPELQTAIAIRGITLREVLNERRRLARVVELTEIARGNTPLTTAIRYPVIYADPPWQYEHVRTESRAIENQYPTLSLDLICALPVHARATDDAVLFLWATSPKLAEALQVITAWGFTYRTCAVWDKGQIGMGYYFRQQHELLLVAVKGAPPMPAMDARPASVIRAPRSEHSAKPAIVYDLIKQMYPTFPKLELFARGTREGWDAWGNQAMDTESLDSIATTPMASKANS